MESNREKERVIKGDVVVEAGIEEAWDAWTTPQGITSFFAPACKIALKPNGPYEILFNPKAKKGKRGAEGTTILAFQTKKMLSFTWNPPPHMPEIRKFFTHVLVRFREIGRDRTKIALIHDGWGEGKEWDDAFDYFSHAWLQIVLPRLQYRFTVGPIDWDNLPKFGGA